MPHGEDILREILNKISTENNFEHGKIEMKPFSTNGANYTTRLYTATISEKDKKDLNLFAKIAVIGEQLRSKEHVKIYETEFYFYTKIMKRYEEIQMKYNVSEKFVAPKLYGYKMDYLKETLVFENLLAKGYQMFDRFETINWDYAKESLRQLAKLHACSMIYAIDYPEEFKEAATFLKIQANIEEIRDYLEDAFSKVLSVTKEENKERLDKFLKESMCTEYFVNVLKPMRVAVLAHSDYRPSNLLHKIDNNGKVRVIPIDYQTLRCGNLVADLMYFIYTGSDKQFRDKYYQKCLDHYYLELSAMLRSYNLTPEKVYSKEDYEYEIKQGVSYGLVAAILSLLIVTVDPKDAPKLDENFKQTDFVVNPTKMYTLRINDIIDDFIQLGII